MVVQVQAQAGQMIAEAGVVAEAQVLAEQLQAGQGIGRHLGRPEENALEAEQRLGHGPAGVHFAH
ncbi:hypothetical protein D3C84_1304170 [compost metagenome]